MKAMNNSFAVIIGIAAFILIGGHSLALEPPKSTPRLSSAEQRAFEQQQKKWLETIETRKLLPQTLIELEVERVIDGDTIIASNRKIRLWGINAPKKGHRHYTAATWFLEGLLEEGPKISCKFIEKDRYDRDVMQCFSQGADLGSSMVQMGLAKDYKRYSGGYYQREEAHAKSKGFGLWLKK